MTLSLMFSTGFSSSYVECGPTNQRAPVIEMLPAAFGNSVKRLYKKSNPAVQQFLANHFCGAAGTFSSAACNG